MGVALAAHRNPADPTDISRNPELSRLVKDRVRSLRFDHREGPRFALSKPSKHAKKLACSEYQAQDRVETNAR
jgi:hypothetical protein